MTFRLNVLIRTQWISSPFVLLSFFHLPHFSLSLDAPLPGSGCESSEAFVDTEDKKYIKISLKKKKKKKVLCIEEEAEGCERQAPPSGDGV